MQNEKITMTEARKTVILPSFEFVDILALGMMIIIGILLIMQIAVPDFMVQIFVLMIGIRVDLPNRNVTTK